MKFVYNMKIAQYIVGGIAKKNYLSAETWWALKMNEQSKIYIASPWSVCKKKMNSMQPDLLSFKLAVI